MFQMGTENLGRSQWRRLMETRIYKKKSHNAFFVSALTVSRYKRLNVLSLKIRIEVI